MNLRPEKFDDIIGNESVKKSLKIIIESAKKRNDVIGSMIISSGPGLGKTTFARAIANEAGLKILMANGGSFTQPKDVLPYLMRLDSKTLFFIDECHLIHKRLQETFFLTSIEDNRIEIAKGCKSIHLNKSTYCMATTNPAGLVKPLYDRMVYNIQLEDYTIEELSSIIKINSDKIKINITDDAIKNIAKRSRFTPRIANSLLQWCRDYAVSTDSNIDDDVVNKSMKLKKIDDKGLDLQDYKYLRVLKRANKPLGLNTLVASSGLSKETVEQQVEPYLLKLNIIEKSSRGRILTNVY